MIEKAYGCDAAGGMSLALEPLPGRVTSMVLQRYATCIRLDNQG